MRTGRPGEDVPRLKALLARHGIKPRHRLGQNFLEDPHVAERIVLASGVRDGDLAVEIGPGLGALTVPLARRASGVIAIEVDRRLCLALGQLLKDAGLDDKVQLCQADARKVDLRKLAEEASLRLGTRKARARVVSNPPYYMASPLLYLLLQDWDLWDGIALTVQLEVAQRITAHPGTRAYGALTVLCRFYFEPRLEFRVPRNAFHPRPEVDSALANLLPRPRPLCCVDDAALRKVVKAAFTHRRKMGPKSLSQALGLDVRFVKDCFLRAGIDPESRPEAISPEGYGALASLLEAER